MENNRSSYTPPKLDGNRVALRGRIFPIQHRRAHDAAHEAGLSLSDYLGALVDKDHGLPNKLDEARRSEDLFNNKAS